MSVKTTNNAFATLAADIAAVQNVVTVTAGQGGRFPTLSAADYFYATLVNALNQTEIVKVTQRTGDTMTVVRATSPIAFSAGDRFELRPTAELFNDKADTADVATAYYNKTQADSAYLNKNTGGTVTGYLAVQYNSPQIQFNDTATAAPGGRWRWTSGGGNMVLQRNTAGAGDYSTATSPVYFRSDDVGVFLKRPIFNGATPWDTANVTPLDKNLGGVVGGAMQFNSGVTVLGYTQVNNNVGVTGTLTANNSVNSTNGAYYFQGDYGRSITQSSGNLYINGFRMLHTGNGNSDLVNNMGYLTSIAVAAPRITGTDNGVGFAITGLEQVDARTVRLVGQYIVPDYSSGGGGGQGG